MNTTKALKWKWSTRYTTLAYLGSASNPHARVYDCAAAPKDSRFRWTTTVGGSVLAVSVDPGTAQKLARSALALGGEET
jgi:hypothetical protein